MACNISPVQVDLIVKFGGSAITNKDKLETLDEESLSKAAQLIRQCHQKKLSCIAVHGAGSFGHHQAREYRVSSGWTRFKDDQGEIDRVKAGFCLTRKSVTQLNHHVVDSLLLNGVPAVGISVCGTWETSSGDVVKYDTSSTEGIIRDGFVPVLHGDCVLDRDRGCTILSGDTIIQNLTEAFDVNRVVFLTSVKGVFGSPQEVNTVAIPLRTILVSQHNTEVDRTADKDNTVRYDDKKDKTESKDGPANEGDHAGGELQTRNNSTDICGSDMIMQNKSTNNVVADDIVMNNAGTDVTGGMSLKFRTAVNIVRNTEGKTKVFICKIGSKYSVDICMYGKTHEADIGTEFLFV